MKETAHDQAVIVHGGAQDLMPDQIAARAPAAWRRLRDDRRVLLTAWAEITILPKLVHSPRLSPLLMRWRMCFAAAGIAVVGRITSHSA
jgi:hypothetical protein